MELDLLIDKVVGMVNETGGVSVDLNKLIILLPEDYWMFPKYPSKTRILPKNIDLKKETYEFINDNKEKFLEENTYLGIWLNPKSDEYYFDITMTEKDKNDASKIAREISKKEGRNIVAIYNPLREKTFFL